MTVKAKCEGKDRFMAPSALVALLESDLQGATATMLELERPYRAARQKKRNLERRLDTIKNNPRRDAPEAFDRLLNNPNASEGECIEWDGIINKNGYGVSYIEGRAQLAHRVAFALSNGVAIVKIRGIVVRHKCDNPKCINPSHLEPGTQADNVRDMHERGRNGHGGPAGSRNASAKLRESDIPVIRERLARGDTLLKIARDYSINKTTVNSIKSGKNWAHVAQPAT